MNKEVESTVKERLIQFIKYKKLSQAKFEKAIGAGNGFVNNISKSIGGDKLQSIICVFPELNTNWLMLGEGEMLKDGFHHGKNLEDYLNTHQISMFDFSRIMNISQNEASELISKNEIDDEIQWRIAETLMIPKMYIEEGEKAMQAKNRLLSKEQEIKDRTRNIEFVLKTNSELAEQIKMQQKTIEALSSAISNQAESLKEKDKQTSEVIELLKEQLKKGQDVENLFRAASSVVEEDE